MKINAELPHPEIQGPPLDRGIRYGHHFVVELISDGRRLWAVASEEGQKLLHEIAHGIGIDGPEAVTEQSGIGTEVVTDQANLLPPQTGADAPTTTTAPGNTFDS